MANRKPVLIDGEFVEVAGRTTLDQLVPSTVRSITTRDGVLVPRARFAQTPVPDGFDTNLSEINKGAPRLHELLDWEQRNVQVWLDSFEPPRAGRRRARLHSSGQLLFVDALPLPDRYRPDEIDIVLAIDNFPSIPPIGLYALNRERHMVTQLSDHFRAFANQAFHKAPAIPGYTWICFHYADNRWSYDAANPAKHDNIGKFLNAFYAHA